VQEAIEWFDKAIADLEAALRETIKPIFLSHLAGTVQQRVMNSGDQA
jgi:hypothetical protein